VIERFRLVNGGNTIEVDIRVEDAGAFTTPWNAIQRYTKLERDPLIEQPCADNNTNYFNQDLEPMPVADRPEF